MYTYSLGDQSALKPIVEGIVGGLSPAQAVGFDLDELLGKASLLQINHGVSEAGNPKQLLTTSQFPEGMPSPTPFNKQVLLSFEKWDEELFNSLPDWMKGDIMKSPEYAYMKNGEKPSVVGEGYTGNLDDLPSRHVDTGEVNVESIPF